MFNNNIISEINSYFTYII